MFILVFLTSGITHYPLLQPERLFLTKRNSFFVEWCTYSGGLHVKYLTQVTMIMFFESYILSVLAYDVKKCRNKCVFTRKIECATYVDEPKHAACWKSHYSARCFVACHYVKTTLSWALSFIIPVKTRKACLLTNEIIILNS